jgi:hypothetical protein
MGDLRIYDFSLMRFHNLDAPTPPRKQMVTIRGVTVEDTVNDEVILQFPNSATVNGLLWSELHAVEGVEDGEVRQLLGKSRLDDGGGGPVSWIEGGQALYLADDWSVVYGPNSGCWQRVRDSDAVNICWLGCADDGSVECGAVINSFCVNWLAERGPNAHLTLFVPNIRARCRAITTTNSSQTAVVESTVGLYVGQFVVGSGIQAGTRISAVGAGSFTLSLPATATGSRVVRVSAWGYRLGTALRSADTLFTTLRGEGEPGIEAVDPSATSTNYVTRGGPVFVVDANVNGIEGDSSPGDHIKLWRFENIGLLGPGAAATTGRGLFASSAGNFQMSARGMRIVGFDIGFLGGNMISCLGINQVKCHGNRVDWKLGVGSASGTVYGPFNCSFTDCDSEYADIGVQFVALQNVSWTGGLTQSNNRHFYFGEEGGVNYGSITGLVIEGKQHLEVDNAYTPGHYPIETSGVATQGINVVMRNVFVTPSVAATLTAAGTFVFDHCNLSCALVVPASVVCEVYGPPGFGFTSISVSEHSRFIPHWGPYPQVAITASGTYAADWANYGEYLQLVLTGDLQINAPTNACVGAKVRYEIRQSGSGRYRLTLQAGIQGTVYNAGNKSDGNTGFELKYDAGVWKVTEPQRPYLVHEVVTASTTQTQGQGLLNARCNYVSSVVNPNDTVTLPKAEAGLEIIVTAGGASTLQVFPGTGDDLGSGVNVATTQVAGVTNRYVAVATGLWAKL